MLLRAPLQGPARLLQYQHKLQELEASLRSGIMLEVTFVTKTQTKKGQYPLNFKAEYGRQKVAWDEVAAKACHQSRPLVLEYAFTADQTLTVEVDTQLSEEAKTRKSFVN